MAFIVFIANFDEAADMDGRLGLDLQRERLVGVDDAQRVVRCDLDVYWARRRACS